MVEDIVNGVIDAITQLIVDLIYFIADIPISIFEFVEHQVFVTEMMILRTFAGTPIAAVAMPIAMSVVGVGYMLFIYSLLWVINKVVPIL